MKPNILKRIDEYLAKGLPSIYADTLLRELLAEHRRLKSIFRAKRRVLSDAKASEAAQAKKASDAWYAAEVAAQAANERADIHAYEKWVRYGDDPTPWIDAEEGDMS